jgi:hypothetical protein
MIGMFPSSEGMKGWVPLVRRRVRHRFTDGGSFSKGGCLDPQASAIPDRFPDHRGLVEGSLSFRLYKRLRFAVARQTARGDFASLRMTKLSYSSCEHSSRKPILSPDFVD